MGLAVRLHDEFERPDASSPLMIEEPTFELLVQRPRGATPARGICKLEGDTSTLCRTTGDIDRPKEFKTTTESGVLVV